MIQVKNVVDALYGLIGWRKDLSDDIAIDSSLTESASGLYYQDAHPLLTLKNLKSIAPDFDNRVWNQYSATVAYNEGDIVEVVSNDDSKLYKCIKAGTGQNPQTQTTYWKPIEPFSVWLEEKTRASIANAINHFIFSAMPKGGTKSVLEHKLLYNSVGRIADRVENKGKVVGLEIHPIHAYDVCTVLHRIGLQAIIPNDMRGTRKVLLNLKSSNSMLEDIVSEPVEAGYYKTAWLDIKAPVVANTQGGQSLYLYYHQKALEAEGLEAINRTIDWSKAPCQPCNQVDYQAYIAWSKYIEVSPFYVDGQDLIEFGEDDFTFDQQSMVYTNKTNYGLNVEMSVYCDYTDFIIRNRQELIPLILKQMAVDVIKEFGYNPNVRANRNSVNVSRTEIVQLLDGSSEAQGLLKELDTMYKGLNISMKGLDKVCRPCCNNGLRYTTT